MNHVAVVHGATVSTDQGSTMAKQIHIVKTPRPASKPTDPDTRTPSGKPLKY